MFKVLYVKEVIDEDLPNILEPWKGDIKKAIESRQFENVIYDPKNVFKDFAIPQWLKDKHSK